MITVVAILVFGIIVVLAFVTVSRSDGGSRRVGGAGPGLRIDEWSVPARRALRQGGRLVAELSTGFGPGVSNGLADDALLEAVSQVESLNSALVPVIENAPTLSDARVCAGLGIRAQRLTNALEQELCIREAGKSTEGALQASTDLAACVDELAASLDDLAARLSRF